MVVISPSGPYTSLQQGISQGLSINDMNFQVLAGNYTGSSNMNLNFGGRSFTLTAVNGSSSTFLLDNPQQPSGNPFFNFVTGDSGTITGKLKILVKGFVSHFR